MVATSAITSAIGLILVFCVDVNIAGVLYSSAWWIFADAYGFAKLYNETPVFNFYMCIPGIVLTLALLMVNMVDMNKVLGSYSGFNGENFTARARTCFAFSCLFGLGSLFSAIYILVAVYLNGDATSYYPGISILISNVLILVSAAVFRVGRIQNNSF